MGYIRFLYFSDLSVRINNDRYRKKETMINRVSDNDYYDYKKLNMPTTSDPNSGSEKFSLDYQRADDKKEDDENKETISGEGLNKNPAGSRSRTVMQSGVKLELSGNVPEKEIMEQKDSLSDLLHTVRSWVTALIQSFKVLLDRIWNDPVPEDTVLSAKEAPLEETDRLSEEYLEINPPASSEVTVEKAVEVPEEVLSGRGNKDKEIQKYLRSGNLEQVISLLTENGHRTMAKNSSLLTYYDRSGRLTSLSASDQERILHGDRNVRKL